MENQTEKQSEIKEQAVCTSCKGVLGLDSMKLQHTDGKLYDYCAKCLVIFLDIVY